GIPGGPEIQGHRGGPTRGIEDLDGEVLGLLHERRVRRPVQGVGHALGRGPHVIGQDLERYLVDLHAGCSTRSRTMLPPPSTVASKPGGTQAVLSSCTITHGPGKRWPASRVARREKGTSCQPPSKKTLSVCSGTG